MKTVQQYQSLLHMHYANKKIHKSSLLASIWIYGQQNESQTQ